jgi:hypothetical protein
VVAEIYVTCYFKITYLDIAPNFQITLSFPLIYLDCSSRVRYQSFVFINLSGLFVIIFLSPIFNNLSGYFFIAADAGLSGRRAAFTGPLSAFRCPSSCVPGSSSLVRWQWQAARGQFACRLSARPPPATSCLLAVDWVVLLLAGCLWPLQACHSKLRQRRQIGQMGRFIFGTS